MPLFLLLAIKILFEKFNRFKFVEISLDSIKLFISEFGFLALLTFLTVYAIVGTKLTFKNISKKKRNAFPVKVTSIRPKNEESLSYLATYVIPLMIQGNIDTYNYIVFSILFFIYYKLYSTSSLILINPILNMKYGLFELDYIHCSNNKVKRNALIISSQKWIEEEEELKLLKLSHRLYYAYKN
ncbi:hypothetical protein CW751_08025 [Brumimicrobium salinarum]|uniref:Uncharacterized protein n=1 Tax=Brumimicrobium salinarum TaxID=2058658 RepID=A0A2I0R298_9FLAO|nr:hypothetical protein CW751_08025 [Brumimicrobium salinarum]